MRAKILVIAGLLALIGAIYAQVRSFEFLNYDDLDNVAARAEIVHGLSWPGIRWAFTSTFVGNYIPLTGLTYLADYSLYGLSPGGYHLTNVVFHAANSVLLFLVLIQLTRQTWPSALVAALFAVHPLHVESVAWVSERKDVLSTFFGLLAISAYARYARTPRVQTYVLMLLLFMCSLLSKSMLVTLPCVLLLLDYWPLRRLHAGRMRWRAWRPLVAEKVPLFVAAIAVSAITIYVQRASSAIPGTSELSLSIRVENAAVSYIRYLILTVRPVDLIPYYMHPKDTLAAWQVSGSALILMAATACAWMLRRSRPYLLVGWLWYVGTLVPVIGLVQVGGQAMADRYTYVPLIGIFIAAAWGAADAISARPPLRYAAAPICIGLIVALSVTAHAQTARWRDSITIFGYTLQIDPKNLTALGNLGSAYYTAGRYEAVIPVAERALRINPLNIGNLQILAMAQRGLGHLDESERLLLKALDLDRRNPRTLNHLALVIADRGQFARAENLLRRAIESDPNFLDAYVNLGNLQLRRGNLEGSAQSYRFVLDRRPRDPDAMSNLGTIALLQADYSRAIDYFRRALAINARDAITRTNLAVALQATGRTEEARREAQAALRDDPTYRKAQRVLADLDEESEKNPAANR